MVDRSAQHSARSSSGSTSAPRSATATARAPASGSASAARGPTAVITDLGVLEPDPETKELVLTHVHPGVEAAAGA